MGLFSSKTVINVSSVAYNIAGDANARGSFYRQSMTYLTASRQSVHEKLPQMYLQSLGMKLKRAYKYSAALPQGLPTASMQLWEYQEFEDAIQSLLDATHGFGKFKVEDAYITRSNTAPAIERHLNQKYGWDSVTGLMAYPPAGLPADTSLLWEQEPSQNILGDTSPKVSRNYSVEFRVNDASIVPDLAVDVSVNATGTFAQQILVAMISEHVVSTRSDATVSRAFQAGDVNSVTNTPTMVMSGSRITITTTTVTIVTNGITTTIQTKIVDDSTSEAVSREYVLGTGQWPTLDSLWIRRANTEQTFFPSIPLRVDNVDVLHDKYSETANFQHIKKQCSLMGMDALLLRDQINTNPNVKEIDYAFMVAGANMNTQSQAEMDYLFRFWDLCRGRSTATQTDLTGWVAQSAMSRGKPKTNSLVIQDPESKNGAYKITIEWDYIKKNLVTGQMGPNAKVGKFVILNGTPTVHEFAFSSTRSSVDSTLVRIRKQINPTQYEELEISGAVHKNDVYEGKVVETLAWKARTDPANEEGFLVPLHMGIFNTMPMSKRTQLAQECIYMVFNTYVKTKKKWYQTGIFKVLLAIVLIAITFFSLGTATPFTATAWGTATVASALLVTSTLGILLISAALSAIYSYMVSYILGKWSGGFESVFGKKWAAVVMTIVSMVASAATAGGGIATNSWLKTAVQLINTASQLFASYAKGATVVRQDNYNSFMKGIEEEKKALDKLSTEFFGKDDLVSIDYLLELQKTLREDTPSVFLTRTLLTGSDIVDITLGQVSEMANMNITPRLEGIEA